MPVRKATTSKQQPKKTPVKFQMDEEKKRKVLKGYKQCRKTMSGEGCIKIVEGGFMGICNVLPKEDVKKMAAKSGVKYSSNRKSMCDKITKKAIETVRQVVKNVK